MCDENKDDHLTNMFNDAKDSFVDRPNELTKMLEEAEKPIYPGSNISKLSFLVRMYLKARNGWGDNGFYQLLSLLGDVFPKDNNIPNSMFKAKKILRTVGMEYEKIHACPNDCILYQKEFMDASKCPMCETSRWKKKSKGEDKKGISGKLLWYILSILRFKHLFQNEQRAKSLIWHDEEIIKDGKLWHPADSLA